MTQRELTRFCPLGARCESCGGDSPALAVVVVKVLGAEMCLTMCQGCAANGRPPQVMLSTAEKFVDQHRRHVAGYVTCGR